MNKQRNDSQDLWKSLIQSSKVIAKDSSLEKEFKAIKEELASQGIKIVANIANNDHVSIWEIRKGRRTAFLTVSTTRTWTVEQKQGKSYSEFDWNVQDWLIEFGIRE